MFEKAKNAERVSTSEKNGEKGTIYYFKCSPFAPLCSPWLCKNHGVVIYYAKPKG